MQGWVKLHRTFIKWEWFKDSNMVHLFIYLLLSANHEEGQWQGITVKRGQLITGLKSLKAGTGISIQRLRTCLSKLEKTGEINNQSTNRFRLVTLCNYDTYQTEVISTNNPPNIQATNKQHAINKQSTPNKNVKNEKNEKKKTFLPDSYEIRLSEYLFKHIKRRKQDFKEPNMHSWAKQIDLMIRIDKREPDVIREVIKWCQDDDFWQNNILSTTKLRKHFDKLELQSERKTIQAGQQEPFRKRTLTAETSNVGFVLTND